MATEQNMMWAVTQAPIEAAKAAIMAVRETDNVVNIARSVQVMPRTGESENCDEWLGCLMSEGK